MDNQKEAMSKSIDIFEKYFKWHVIKTLGGGSIEIIEGKQDKKSQEMDMKDGIDWIYTDLHGVKKNFGSRLQWDDDWETFTIRTDRESGAKTELEKRMEARAKGELYNHYTFHGYFDTVKKEIISYAIAKTNDILLMIDNKWGYGERHTGPAQKGQAGFVYVNWKIMLAQELDGCLSKDFPIEIVEGYNIDYREKRLEGFF